MGRHRLFNAERKLRQDKQSYRTVVFMTDGTPYIVWHIWMTIAPHPADIESFPVMVK